MNARIYHWNDDERFVTDGFSGAISLPMLPDLIQIYTVSLATAALTIRHGSESGTIWIEHGEIVHAVCGELVGEQAVYRLLEWQNGHFTHTPDVSAPAHTITASWQKVLMEGCRLLDEAPRAHVEPFDLVLRQIEGALEGFLAAAIVDQDGFLLAQRSRSEAIDLSGASSAIAELVHQHARIMESLAQPSSLLDVLSLLGDQVHLLQPLPGKRLLLYVIADRSRVNPALMRRLAGEAVERTG